MAKRAAEKHIPHDILDAAREVGLTTPSLYVGRSNGFKDLPPRASLAELLQGGEYYNPLPRDPPAGDARS
jgi:hypothetical protein